MEGKKVFEASAVIAPERGLTREIVVREIEKSAALKGLTIDHWEHFTHDGAPMFGAIAYG